MGLVAFFAWAGGAERRAGATGDCELAAVIGSFEEAVVVHSRRPLLARCGWGQHQLRRLSFQDIVACRGGGGLMGCGHGVSRRW